MNEGTLRKGLGLLSIRVLIVQVMGRLKPKLGPTSDFAHRVQAQYLCHFRRISKKYPDTHETETYPYSTHNHGLSDFWCTFLGVKPKGLGPQKNRNISLGKPYDPIAISKLSFSKHLGWTLDPPPEE